MGAGPLVRQLPWRNLNDAGVAVDSMLSPEVILETASLPLEGARLAPQLSLDLTYACIQNPVILLL